MSRVINRPFFSLDFYGGIDFIFVYLDECDNPMVHEASPYQEEAEWIRPLNINLKDYIERAIDYERERYKEIN
ncbi:hypothetical protein [Flavobacterium sp.]|jgi:hypothetical protein|uniref:hypothetical protein n=1 Tax=Flavobacterium sp. TaxID=239 RepID=UPI0022C7EC62|nr:hypothetical protein [Flavobacterium sp.]MCZ8091415.1 hypothetical protein [Flavobacterium sp.]